MFQLAEILTGLLNAGQNVLNAGLSQTYGNLPATFIVHLAGLFLMLPLALAGRLKPVGAAPWYLHLGGVVGVVYVVCANMAIGTLGVTLNLALCLLGQMLASAAVDQFGLGGMAVVPMNREKALGLILIAVGAGVMLLW